MDVAALVRPLYEGKRVALVGGVVQSKTTMVNDLRAVGAGDCLVVGGRGTGPEPDAELVVLDTPVASPSEEFRLWERLAASPPPEVVDALDRFAPDLVLASGIESFDSFAGRPLFGARRPEWVALEDKTIVDALWDDAGVTRAPSEVVAVADAWAAHERLDVGEGTVWSGDVREGWHGGGELVRPVRSPDEAATASKVLGASCDRVRVAPFLEGLPCSIHGFVTGTGTAAFRPVEMVVLRTPTGFRYAACATTWDPAPADREAMRDVARRVGDHLAERVAYRGGFTVDGVMTRDGFRPTELNPRIGAGLGYLRYALPGVPLLLLHFGLIAGAVDADHRAIESLVLGAADRVRLRMTHVFFERQVEAETVSEGDVTFILGPGSMGGFLRVITSTTPLDGEPFGPVAAAALRRADERWGLGLGPLEPAPAVR